MKANTSRAEGAVALITGTSSGFGLLTAVTLAAKGYTVIATMRNLNRKEGLERQAAQAGVLQGIHMVGMDVTDEDSISAAVTDIYRNFGRIDLLINNAGLAVGGFVEEVSMEDWRLQMETNFFGLVAVTRAVLPVMRRQGHGTIVNIGSVSGLAGFPGYAPYAASKFAVEGFSESLRHEMRPFGIHVVLLEPGSYRTPIWNKGIGHIRRTAGSPYETMLDSVLNYSRKSAETAPDPQEVADLIGYITTLKAPRLRYPIGKGARLLIVGKTLLPWKWLERIIARGLGQRNG
ncbi:SDR family oxidoreductase [Paenibacillus albidus]|uniref:SDR family oxidoreductase n=1 Tax=Paenibacillus albidus TaxID=2041023 RepID=UPI002035A127|nr:SDR family oxidoreductase [Paenibacillus albidus]